MADHQLLGPLAKDLKDDIGRNLQAPTSLLLPAPVRSSILRLAALVFEMARRIDKLNQDRTPP